MAKKTIKDVQTQGKKVLIRVDFNVPLNPEGAISNDRRIRAALPTIRAAIDGGASVILMTHIGRPTGDPDADKVLTTDCVAERLAMLLNRNIRKADEVVGENVTRVVKSLKKGEVLVLENLRFHIGEKKGDHELAGQLAALADVYVNDAFGTCHRSDASVLAVPRLFPPGSRVAGLLLHRELTIVERLLSHPESPMVAILGGAKVSDKIELIKNLAPRVSKLLIGGAMSFTFRKAMGHSVGKSLVEEAALDTARNLMDICGEKLVLPVDHIAAPSLSEDAETQIVRPESFPVDLDGADIGPETIARFEQEISLARTVVWNGPMGKFELTPFSHGTHAIAKAMANCAGTTVVGGGETAESVEEAKLAEHMTHVSTGGGAFLAYLGGEQFQSLSVLDDA